MNTSKLFLLRARSLYRISERERGQTLKSLVLVFAVCVPAKIINLKLLYKGAGHKRDMLKCSAELLK